MTALARKRGASVAERDRRYRAHLKAGTLRESDRKSFYRGWRNAGRVIHREQ